MSCDEILLYPSTDDADADAAAAARQQRFAEASAPESSPPNIVLRIVRFTPLRVRNYNRRRIIVVVIVGIVVVPPE